MKKKVITHIGASVGCLIPFYCAGAYYDVLPSGNGVSVCLAGSTAKVEKVNELAKVLRDKTLVSDNVIVEDAKEVGFQRCIIKIKEKKK